MNHQRALLSGASFVLFLLVALPALAQQDQKPANESSYEAVLQVILGSDRAGELPQNLSPIARQLRSNYSFAGYRVANTYIGRLSSGGSLEYKSVADIFGQPQESDLPTFLEWNLGRLREAKDEKGQTVFLADPFRFGARVPVRVSRAKVGDTGGDAVNYEGVGLTAYRISVASSRPTLVGTISLPKTAGTMFLVLTVRPAEN
jgi:hypothetical protein